MILKIYLDRYHSDYRWLVKYYVGDDEQKIPVHNFRGAIRYYLNHQNTRENVIIYGAPMHEYFYGKYNNEYFHEFCFRAINMELKGLGLLDFQFNIDKLDYEEG